MSHFAGPTMRKFLALRDQSSRRLEPFSVSTNTAAFSALIAKSIRLSFA